MSSIRNNQSAQTYYNIAQLSERELFDYYRL